MSLFQIMIPLAFIVLSCSDISEKQIRMKNDTSTIDFRDTSYVSLWTQDCANFGKLESKLALFNSKYIEILFDKELEVVQLDTSKCYFLWNDISNRFITDLEFKNGRILRNTDNVDDLEKILDLYMKERTNNSYLAGTEYRWRSR